MAIPYWLFPIGTVRVRAAWRPHRHGLLEGPPALSGPEGGTAEGLLFLRDVQLCDVRAKKEERPDVGNDVARVCPTRVNHRMGCSGSKDVEAKAVVAVEPEVNDLVQKFCAFGPDTASYCTEDCLMNPPGAPPMPVPVMLGMMDAMKGTFPDWKSLMHGVTKNLDGTYSVLTQQCLGR